MRHRRRPTSRRQRSQEEEAELGVFHARRPLFSSAQSDGSNLDQTRMGFCRSKRGNPRLRRGSEAFPARNARGVRSVFRQGVHDPRNAVRDQPWKEHHSRLRAGCFRRSRLPPQSGGCRLAGSHLLTVCQRHASIVVGGPPADGARRSARTRAPSGGIPGQGHCRRNLQYRSRARQRVLPLLRRARPRVRRPRRVRFRTPRRTARRR